MKHGQIFCLAAGLAALVACGSKPVMVGELPAFPGAEELEALGWKSGLVGIVVKFVDINAITAAANKGNELFQNKIWVRGKQTPTVIMITDSSDKTHKELILSMATN